jgi:hypothetical protein
MKKRMTNPEYDGKQMSELSYILKSAVSMELRVKNSEIDTIITMMEHYGLKYKNSWASMELPEHTVIDFWKKELIKKG